MLGSLNVIYLSRPIEYLAECLDWVDGDELGGDVCGLALAS